jgi:hypothetical protein
LHDAQVFANTQLLGCLLTLDALGDSRHFDGHRSLRMHEAAEPHSSVGDAAIDRLYFFL